MTNPDAPDPRAAITAPAATHEAGPDDNPEVRYERSDIASRGVVTFVAVLAVCLVVFGFLLRGLFRLYQDRDNTADKRDYLPLAITERDNLSTTPRLEGMDPNQDVGRAWPTKSTPGSSPRVWFGYNVRVVPSGGSPAAGTDAEKLDLLAADAMAQKIQKVDTTLAELAGKLPVRAGSKGLPADVIRRSVGEGDAGRSAGEKSP
jgi:hypothetical protein